MDIRTNTDTTAPTTTATELSVVGMHCSSCEHHIESALLGLPGVTKVEVDRRGGRVRIDHAASAAVGTLIRAIEEQGYLASIA